MVILIMQNNYLISILGIQTVGGISEDVELICVGSYIKKNNKYYIVYSEYDEDSPKSKTTNTLKVEENKVTLIRTGFKSSRLILEKGVKHICEYNMGSYSMFVGVSTNNIDCSLDNNGGELHIKYSLDTDSKLLSTNEIHIKIKENV